MSDYGGGMRALSNAPCFIRPAQKDDRPGHSQPDRKLAEGRGFLLIISGFVKILGRHPGFITI
jgi:hypothetical protein